MLFNSDKHGIIHSYLFGETKIRANNDPQVCCYKWYGTYSLNLKIVRVKLPWVHQHLLCTRGVYSLLKYSMKDLLKYWELKRNKRKPQKFRCDASARIWLQCLTQMHCNPKRLEVCLLSHTASWTILLTKFNLIGSIDEISVA